MKEISPDKFDFIIDEGEEGGGLRLIMITQEALDKVEVGSASAKTTFEGVTVGDMFFKLPGLEAEVREMGDLPKTIYIAQIDMSGNELWYVNIPNNFENNEPTVKPDPQ